MSIFEKSESYRPFKYPQFVTAERKHRVDMHWTEQQVDLSDDLRQYHAKDGLKTDNVSHERNKLLLEKLLPLFTESDSTVARGYIKLLPYVHNNEASALLLTQAAREVTHFRGYALANETFGFPESSWVEYKAHKAMQDKLDLMSYDNGDLGNKVNWCTQLGQILYGEGICLFGSFCTLLNYKRSGLLMGFNSVNEWSLLDEAEHIMNNISVMRAAWIDLTEDERDSLANNLIRISDNYVKVEHEFIDLIYEDGPLEDLDKGDLKDYITYLGKYWTHQLGLIGSLEVPENPLGWMDWMLSGQKNTNFFEGKVTDYSHNGLAGEIDYTKYQGD